MLLGRALLAIFVAWGSTVEATRPATLVFGMIPIDPALYPRVRYTCARATVTLRGWPLDFWVENGMSPTLRSFEPGIHPTALLCDFVVLGILAFSAWNLLGKWRFRYGLADIFTATTAVALTLSIHTLAWNHDFDLSKFAIDVGVFCTLIVAVRTARDYSRRRGWHLDLRSVRR
jgi:hypothetical protein